jgi:membrane-associated protease RseP (regulator of RpoE activity)
MTDAPRPPSAVRHLVLLVVTAATMTLFQGPIFTAALLAILLAHESGHYFLCRRHGIDASLPYFIPGPTIFGTFGAFIRIRSPFPDRNALFDVGAAGPWAGFLISVPVLAVGLAHSTITAAAPDPATTFRLGDSLLIRGLTWLIVGPLPDGKDVLFNPLALAGWAGILVTSLNLLPAGQLDGGHVVFATGLRSRLYSLVPVPVLLWLAWFRWPGWVLWAVVLLVMAALGHPPTMDEARPLSPARRLAAALTVILFVLTFIPEPIGVFQ